MQLGKLRIPWPGGKTGDDDPHWDFFLNQPAQDPQNQIDTRIRGSREGHVYPAMVDTHTPRIMSEHLKELYRFFGACSSGILDLSAHLHVRPEGGDHPFALIGVFKAAADPRDHPGIGGQAPVLEGAFATFNIGAIIREWGFRATRVPAIDGDRAAAAAGLGTLNRAGRLVTPQFGAKVYVADVILTDLPVAPDR